MEKEIKGVTDKKCEPEMQPVNTTQDSAKNRVNESCKNYRVVAESGTNALHSGHISQAENLIKGGIFKKKQQAPK